MKRIFLMLLLVTTGVIAKENTTVKGDKSPKGIDWQILGKALEKSRKDGKLVFVDVMAQWCGPCHVMEKTTFQDKGVISTLAKHFQSVRLDADSEERIPCGGQMLPINVCVGDVWGVEGVPTLLFLAPSGKPLLRLTTALEPDQMQRLLDEVQAVKMDLLKEAGQ